MSNSITILLKICKNIPGNSIVNTTSASGERGSEMSLDVVCSALFRFLPTFHQHVCFTLFITQICLDTLDRASPKEFI